MPSQLRMRQSALWIRLRRLIATAAAASMTKARMARARIIGRRRKSKVESRKPELPGHDPTVPEPSTFDLRPSSYSCGVTIGARAETGTESATEQQERAGRQDEP